MRSRKHMQRPLQERLMTKKIFLTGATGFLGFYLAQRLLQDEQTNVILLARSGKGLSAGQRVGKLFRERLGDEGYSSIKDRLEVIDGSITSPGLGLTKSDQQRLSKEISAIFHSAALAQFDVPYEKIEKINVGGTRRVLDFAMQCLANGPLESVNHVSTIAVSGDYRGVFREDSLDKGQGFKNTYEQTKFEAEQLIEAYRAKGLNINIFRPSGIIGDSHDGYAINFRVIYQPIRIFSLGVYKQIPADGSIKCNLVPADSLSDAVYLIHTHGRPHNRTFHMINTNEVTGDFIFRTAAEFFGYADPERIPLADFDMESLKGARRALLGPYIPYLNHDGVQYDNSEAMSILRENGFQWPEVDEELLHTIFKFCLDRRFITPENMIIS